MSEFLRILATLFVAISPAAVAATAHQAGPRLSARTIAIAATLSIAIYAAAAFGADAVLAGIDIEPETFRVSAGLVMVAGGVFTIWSGSAGYSGELGSRSAALFPLAVPLLASPAGLAAVLSQSADGETSTALAAAAVVVLLAAAALMARLGRFRATVDGLARLGGALLIAFAGAMIVDGIRAV